MPSCSTAAQETGSEQQLESDRDVYSHPNIFLERIRTDALEDHEDIVNIGGRTITNLRFADDIDGLAGEEEEPANLVERLDKVSTAYEDLLTIVKRRKLQWYGHVSRSSGLTKTVLQGTVKGGRRQDRQKKRWEDNIRVWTSLGFGKS